MNRKTKLDVVDLKLPCKRKLQDFHHSLSSNDSFYYPKTFYRQLYFETFDNTTNCIKYRFNQKDYQIYVHLQEILTNVFKEQGRKNNLQIVIQNYSVDELDVPSLKTQLFLLSEIAKFCSLRSRMQLSEIIALFRKLDTIKRMLVAEVIKLVKWTLVTPATNAVSERFSSFSSLKRIKIIFKQQQRIIG